MMEKYERKKFRGNRKRPEVQREFCFVAKKSIAYTTRWKIYRKVGKNEKKNPMSWNWQICREYKKPNQNSPLIDWLAVFCSCFFPIPSLPIPENPIHYKFCNFLIYPRSGPTYKVLQCVTQRAPTGIAHLHTVQGQDYSPANHLD